MYSAARTFIMVRVHWHGMSQRFQFIPDFLSTTSTEIKLKKLTLLLVSGHAP